MAEAAYRKYPNPHSVNVHTLDTVERRETATGGLFSHRIFGTKWNIPTIALNIIGTNPVMRVNEQSLCDPHTKTLTISAKNITLRNLFTVHETLEYTVNPADPSTTILRQSARVTVHGVPLLGDLLERLFVHNYISTVSNGRQGVEHVAQTIVEEMS
jgi:hypothetical protein